MPRKSVWQVLIAVVLGITAFGPQHLAAQETSEPPSGLTVTGFGQASAPAESATMQIVIGAPSFGPPQAPRPGATPGAEEREAVAPVVRSLVDAGISEGAIEVIVGPYLGNLAISGGPAKALISFDLSDPTAQRLSGLVDAASVGAAQEGLLVSGVGVRYAVSDCEALERQAREAAIADARDRADVQAELLNVTTGELLAAHDVSFDPSWSAVFAGPTPLQSCLPFEQDIILPGAYVSGTLAFDPTQEPVVTVYAQVEMTFAMTGESDATPTS